MKDLALLLIDPQIDFHEGGSLAVPGANADAERLATWIDRVYPAKVYVSLDTHSTHDIAHPKAWLGTDGGTPEPFSTISAEDVRSGKWAFQGLYKEKVGIPFLGSQQRTQTRAVRYLEALEDRGHSHTIWPPHCVKHSEGHAIVPVLREALEMLDWGTGSVEYIYKGENPFREEFSVFESLDGHETNPELAWELRSFDRAYIAGQALSHCVAESCRYLMRLGPVDTFTLLTDATSPVPGFEGAAEEFLKEWVAAGGQVQKTTG